MPIPPLPIRPGGGKPDQPICMMGFFGWGFFLKFFLFIGGTYFFIYLANRVVIFWMISRRKERHANLSRLVRREIWRLGGMDNIERMSERVARKGKNATLNHRDKTIQIYHRKIEIIKSSENIDEQLENLEKSLDLFTSKAVMKGGVKNIAQRVSHIAKFQISPHEVVKTVQSCLLEKVFILSEEDREVMNHWDIENVISSRIIWSHFIQDARLQSSSVCKIVERSRNKKPEKVYLAIKIMILLKVGGIRKALYERALKSPESLHQTFMQLKNSQINNSIMSLLRLQRGKYLAGENIAKMIYQQIVELEQFEKQYISQRAREEEHKRQKKQSSHPTNHPGQLGKCYHILECQESDSTAFIKKSYRKLALKNHPDRSPNSESHEGFIKIQQAYHKIIQFRKKAS